MDRTGDTHASEPSNTASHSARVRDLNSSARRALSAGHCFLSPRSGRSVSPIRVTIASQNCGSSEPTAMNSPSAVS